MHLTESFQMLCLTFSAVLISAIMDLEEGIQINDSWETFKALYNKHYDPKEEEIRKQTFEKNVEFILHQNLRSGQDQRSFQLGINEFTDMSYEEFERKLVSANLKSGSNTSHSSSFKIVRREDDIPKELDWRKKGYVSPVRNQGECGACWAFSATSALESHYYIVTSKKVELSVQKLIDCYSYGMGCLIGSPEIAFDCTIKYANGAMIGEKCYRYKAKVEKCHSNDTCEGATMKGFEIVRGGNEDDLLFIVATRGPVVVQIDARKRDIQLYKNGIYKSNSWQLIPNHASLVVGYGTENGESYWLLKNSWGTSWGLSGYMKLARNANNSLGIANLGSFPVV